jgi:hypothetical protein
MKSQQQDTFGRYGYSRRAVARLVFLVIAASGCSGSLESQPAASYCDARQAPWPGVVDVQSWSRKVHLEDHRFIDEYLGHIELCAVAHRTTTGQVYVAHAAAEKRLRGEAAQLAFGGEIDAISIDLNGQQLARVTFWLWLGTPGKEGTEQVVFDLREPEDTYMRTTTHPPYTRAVRRSYQIIGLEQAARVTVLDLESFAPTSVSSPMVLEELLEIRHDIEDFAVEVDGKLTSYLIDSHGEVW